jgi:hypothetical protein
MAAGIGGLAAAARTATYSAETTGARAQLGGSVSEDAMPYGAIGKLKISRLILGSNLMSACAHDRDLIYVSSLMKAYNTEARILDTLELAESAGVNIVLQGDPALIKKYNAERGGSMRQIRPLVVDEADDEQKVKEKIGALMGEEAAALYVYGGSADILVRSGKAALIGKAVEWAKQAGAVIGVGGHSLQVVVECEKHGFAPDFYLKTFHHDQYWSATPREQRKDFCWYDGPSKEVHGYYDNIWCLDPEKTIEVMREVKAPWIAYKVLAAGAIHPLRGFEYAFRNGADFVAAGMFDFQIREDAVITKRIVAKCKDRERPWRA